MRKLLVVAATVAVVLGLSGCAAGAPSAQGTWGDPGSHGRPYLTLEHGGTLIGSDGCNRLRGKWHQSGSTVTFSVMSSTLMACAGVDTWLSTASTAEISSSTMTVYGTGHRRIGSLPRRAS